MENKKHILDVEQVGVAIGKEQLLHEVSFSLLEGEMLTIVGPNGAGKTTLFRALLGLIPYEGEIHWHGKQVFGYVPQRFYVDRTFPLTVEEFFLGKMKESFWRPKPAVKNKIRDQLAVVGAEHTQQKILGFLSSGELQRVLIAYALISNPTVLFFDEPTAGVDMTGEVTVYKILKNLVKERGLSVLLITHDLSIVSEYADQVICLNKQAFCFGVPEQVLTPVTLSQIYGKEAGFFAHRHL